MKKTDEETEVYEDKKVDSVEILRIYTSFTNL